MASLFVLIAIFLWSSLGVFVRTAGVDIHILMFYSLVVAVFFQGIILLRKKHLREITDVRMLKYPLVLGVMSVINTFTFFYAYRYTTIANAVLTHYTAPVIVAFLSPFFLNERLTARLAVVLLLASTGLWIMLDGFSFDSRHTMGIAAGLASGFAYAAIVIFLRMHTRKFTPLVFVFLSNIAMIILLAPFVREFPVRAVASYLTLGIVHSTIAPVLYYRGLQEISANRAAVLGYLEPVCAILISMIFLREMPGLNALIGGLFIIVSGYLTLKS